MFLRKYQMGAECWCARMARLCRERSRKGAGGVELNATSVTLYQATRSSCGECQGQVYMTDSPLRSDSQYLEISCLFR